MAATSTPLQEPRSNRQNRVAAGWARGLGRTFRRVALFRIDGTHARVAAVQGMGHPPLGAGLSLLEPTPLRWAIEAASPIIGAGSAPGGATVAATLGLSTPRAYAVIPLVVRGSLAALAYVDQASDPLPVAAASELFSFVGKLLDKPKPTEAALSARRGFRSTSSRERRRRSRRPGLDALGRVEVPTESEPVAHLEVVRPTETQPPQPQHHPTPPPVPADALPEHARVEEDLFSVDAIARTMAESTMDAVAHPESVDAATAEPITAPEAEFAPAPAPEPEPATAPEVVAPQTAVVEPTVDERPQPFVAIAPPITGPALVTPEGVVFGDSAPAPRTRHWPRWLTWVAAAALLGAALAGVVLVRMAPVADAVDGERIIKIPRDANVAGIASHLENERLIRSGELFKLLARVTETDRSLRAGVYRLPTRAWMWDVLNELHTGQVNTRTVTIPEGLTLSEIATTLESAGLARATDVLREARSPELLAHFGIPGDTLEGFLFPETYSMAQGLSAREVLTVMVEEFYARLAEIPSAAGATPEELQTQVTLASIVEREARDKSELHRVAGVFHNRLQRNIKLESCATVQYVLGEPKKRLTLRDVRTQSPYNTYLNPGLPPGPIASPGLPALAAVFEPEEHDYLFFFAREDGTHQHVFSRTYEAHQAKQRKYRKR